MSELEHDDDEREESGGAAVAIVGPPFVCPECGQEFGSNLLLGGHRFHRHGYRNPSPSHKKKSPGSPGRPRKDGSPARPKTQPAGEESTSRRQTRRREAIRQTLVELAEFQDQMAGLETGEPERLADLIRRDADKIANGIAWTAERFRPLGRGVDLLFGHGGPITIARSFLGLGRFVLTRWRRAANEARDRGEGLVIEYPPGTDAEGLAAELNSRYGMEG